MPEGGILDSGSAGQRSWCAQGCVGSTPHYSGGGCYGSHQDLKSRESCLRGNRGLTSKYW